MPSIEPAVGAGERESRPRVLITCKPFAETLELLNSKLAVDSNTSVEPLSAAQLRVRARNVDGLLVFMPDRVDAQLLEHCPRLRVIAAALKGYDNIDLAAARARGITVTIVEDLLTAPTAELAVTLLLGLARRVRDGDLYVRSGQHRGWRPHLYGFGLTGARIGLLGFGAIGQAIARRLAGFECELVHTDPAAPDAAERSRPVTFDELLRTCDAVVISTPLLPQTAGLIDAAALAKLAPHALVVNVGRGSVIDEDAIAEAIDGGRLGGYASDVFAFEDRSRPGRPATVPDALLGAPRTLFTPHLGSATTRARRAIERRAAETLLKVLT